METKKEDQIQNLDNLIRKGKYVEGLELSKKMEQNETLNQKDLLRAQLLRTFILRRIEKYDESLRLSEQIFRKCKNNNFELLEIESLIMMGSINRAIANYDQALKNILTAEEILLSLQDKKSDTRLRLEGRLNRVKGAIFRSKSSYDEALELLLKAKTIQEEQYDRFHLADSYKELGIILWLKGNLDEGLIYFQKSFKILQELGNEWEAIENLNNIGIIHIYKGEHQTALNYLFQSMEFSKKLGKETSLSNVLNNIGEIYGNYLGEPAKALKFFEKSLDLSRKLSAKIDNRLEIAVKLLNIGGVHENKGEFELALEYFQDSLGMLQALNEKHYIADCLQGIGDVYRKKGLFPKALEHYQKSLAIRKEIGNAVEESSTLNSLIALTVDMQSLKEAEKYLEQLESLREASENKILNLRYRLCRAIYLKAGGSSTEDLSFNSLYGVLNKLVTAQQLLDGIISEKIVVHNLTVDAIFNYCEILFTELKTLGNDQVLGEIDKLTQKLMQIGIEKNYYALQAKTYFLQAKLVLLKPSVDEAKKLLTKAQKITQEKGYDRLGIIISKELKKLEGELPEWLMEEEISFIDKISKLQLEGLIVSLRQNRVESLATGEIKAPNIQQLASFTRSLKERKISW
ncbi:MAG: tetratricopeptide repeat protein [Promethearchaeota archaeon]|nr:MAG: tetratricopeptide repeat protein [Candidatus Lokiarchaeota archaeon]